jgi:hypothetical protein
MQTPPAPQPVFTMQLLPVGHGVFTSQDAIWLQNSLFPQVLPPPKVWAQKQMSIPPVPHCEKSGAVQDPGHVAEQMPLTQVCPLGHAIPQPPQLVLLVLVFVHVPLQHSVDPAPQQMLPHVNVLAATQVLPHSVVPLGQTQLPSQSGSGTMPAGQFTQVVTPKIVHAIVTVPAAPVEAHWQVQLDASRIIPVGQFVTHC